MTSFETQLRLKRIAAAQQLFEMGQRGDFDQVIAARMAAKVAWKRAWQAESEE